MQHLNDKQREAVRKIIGPSQSTFILNGPPGTGKTLTLATAIELIFHQNSNRRILICAPTNKAADVIAEEVQKTKLVYQHEIIRLNSVSRDVEEQNSNLKPITRIVPHNIYEMDKFVYKWPELKEFQHFKIIICTLGIVPTFAKFYKPLLVLKECRFSHIFIDEAGQSPEIDCWVPLCLLASPQTRLILAGDSKQLGPVATAKCLDNKKNGYKLTLMERLLNDTFFDRV